MGAPHPTLASVIMSRQACKCMTAAATRNLLRVDAARVNKAVAARKDAAASMRTAQGPARLLPVPEHRSSCGVAHLPEQRKSGVGALEGLWVDMTRLLHHPRSRTQAASSTLNHGFFPNLQILRHGIVSCFILVMFVCCFILFSSLRHGIVSCFILDVFFAQYVCCFILFSPLQLV